MNTSRTPRRGLFRRLRSALRRDEVRTLDDGLITLSSRLGLHDADVVAKKKTLAADFQVIDTDSCPRSIFYAPNMDGQVDPGEVVFLFVPGETPADEPIERAIVVVARSGDQVAGLLTSPNPEHASKETWIDIGAGPWDPAGRQSWACLDKVIRVPELAIRRQGAVIPQRRFSRIANKLRSEYGWG
ncbi:MAG: growth inhibitor PemK [Corynebacterium sp.]|uniref:growth inhibitor PemK n=1 Tax=Corynebacterium sp. TaxID=1720 RepID=UPI0026DAD618|nr:growth inhibitor PemK [Corynebacterium sp.]MDO4761390.1 growth inhibitor PemK [Corynebacterium sp.]